MWFEDALRRDTIERAISVVSRSDLLISIGTSAVVYPAAGLPIEAKRNGATLVEVNPEETPISSYYDMHMRMNASEALALLCRSYTGEP